MQFFHGYNVIIINFYNHSQRMLLFQPGLSRRLIPSPFDGLKFLAGPLAGGPGSEIKQGNISVGLHEELVRAKRRDRIPGRMCANV